MVSSRRLLVGAVLRRSILLIDGCARSVLLPNLVPLLILSRQPSATDDDAPLDTPPFMPLAGTYFLPDHPTQTSYLNVYLTAGLCMAFYLLGQTIGSGIGSSHLIGAYFNPNPSPTDPTSDSNFHLRFSVLSSFPLCLVLLTLVVDFRSEATLAFLRMITAIFAGLATRIASRR